MFRYIHWRESNFIQSTGATDRTAQHLAERTEVHQLWTVGHWDPYRREKHTEFTDNLSHPWRDCFCENHAKLQKVVVTLDPFPAKPWKWRQEECWAAAKMRRQFGILQGVESGRFKTESLRCLITVQGALIWMFDALIICNYHQFSQEVFKKKRHHKTPPGDANRGANLGPWLHHIMSIYTDGAAACGWVPVGRTTKSCKAMWPRSQVLSGRCRWRLKSWDVRFFVDGFWQCLAWIPLSYTSKTFKNNMYVIYSMYKYIETNMFCGGDSPCQTEFSKPNKNPQNESQLRRPEQNWKSSNDSAMKSRPKESRPQNGSSPSTPIQLRDRICSKRSWRLTGCLGILALGSL